MSRLKRLLPLVIVVAAACSDDPFGPTPWNDAPDTVTIFSASRPELLGQPSAVDITAFPFVLALPIESPAVTGNWDFALLDGNGQLLLAPASSFQGLESRARIAVLPDTALDAVTSASRDTADYTAQPVPVVAGNVYIVRSRRAQCSALRNGHNYAKLRAVEIDVAAGRLKFEIVRNPLCDDRSFIPPEDDD